MTKYIFVAGGVMSSIGKGITTASIGKILQGKGFAVTSVKFDPYINVDAGTMNPIEHGEVFVTNDGTECDQDVGNYERFLDRDLSAVNYATTGKIYQTVIARERNLEYGGKCVEVVPDIPNEVIRRIKAAACPPSSRYPKTSRHNATQSRRQSSANPGPPAKNRKMKIEELAIEKVSSRLGAPHGRAEYPLSDAPRSVRLFRVPLDSGGYDQGGAYWGHGAPIYCFAQPPEQGAGSAR